MVRIPVFGIQRDQDAPAKMPSCPKNKRIEPRMLRRNPTTRLERD
jgi:hypothetical protein